MTGSTSASMTSSGARPGRARAGGVSVWWPTPTRPADHFSPDELARSAEAHRGPWRVRLVAGALRLVALALVALVASRFGRPVGGGAEVGEGERWVRAGVAALAVSGALTFPGLVAGWWLRRTGSATPIAVPGAGRPGRLAGRLGGRVAELALAAVAARFALPVLDDGWLAALVIALVVAGGATMSAARAATELRTAPPLPDRPETEPGGRAGVEPGGRAGVEPGGRAGVEPGGRAGVESGLVELAGRAGLAGLRFGLLDAGSTPSTAAGADPPGACAVGRPGAGGVLINGTLLDSPAGIRRFVVAHELTHLVRRHPVVQVGLEMLAAVAVLGAVPLIASLRPGWLGRPLDDPLVLPAVVLVVVVAVSLVRVPVAWVLRALERSADLGAVSLAGPLDRVEARTLLLRSGLDLDPPRLGRLLASHPSAAERAELLRRAARGH